MTVKFALQDMNNAVLDLQAADYNTFARPLKRLAQTLASDDLKEIADGLRNKVDFDCFLTSADGGGSMVGSARLNWPTDREQELGLSIALIERGAENPDWFTDFAYTYYHGGNKFIESIRKVVTSAIIPFSRDFTIYVEDNRSEERQIEDTTHDLGRIFVVHGHAEAPKEAVARFLMQMELEPVILHEQASRGMTVLEKLIANANVGYAVVLLTADDLGRSKSEDMDSNRARQNVILELGYFLGRLGRERVMAIVEKGVEIPSDYMGVVYVPLDAGGAWRQKLAQEMQVAGYEIDWNKVMR